MERILQYYETELEYIRRAFVDFEAAHPQKAKALGVTAGRSNDPDIQRLADSIALHAARLSQRLDDTLPETALDLVRMLAPTFLLGAPSYGAVQIDADEEMISDPVELEAGTHMPVVLNGNTPNCMFTVARDVSLRPIMVTDVRLDRAPLKFDVPGSLRGCEAAICVTLSPGDKTQGLKDMSMAEIELYVSASGGRKRRLVDVLSGDVLGVGYAVAGSGPNRVRTTKMLDEAQFGLSMASDPGTYLPREATQTPALSRLRDFLAYPDKASFFTLAETDDGFSAVPAGPVELRFFLSSHGAQQLTELDLGDIVTNVVPIINLYLDQSRPVRYDYARMQVPVKPATAAEMEVACLQIRDVLKLTPEGEIVLPRITSPQRRQAEDLPVWQERFTVGEFDTARRDVSFSISPDLGPDPEPLDFVANVFCSNGRAAFAPRPGTKVFFENDALAEVPFTLLDEPSVPVLPDVSAERLWDVISMVNGNFTTIFDAEDPIEALKEAIHLCAPSGYADAANAIWDVKVTQSIAPIQIGSNVLLSAGSHVEVVLDLEALPFARNVFGTALHLYFKSLISYDRFLKLSLRERGRDQPFKVFAGQHGGQICG